MAVSYELKEFRLIEPMKATFAAADKEVLAGNTTTVSVNSGAGRMCITIGPVKQIITREAAERAGKKLSTLSANSEVRFFDAPIVAKDAPPELIDVFKHANYKLEDSDTYVVVEVANWIKDGNGSPALATLMRNPVFACYVAALAVSASMTDSDSSFSTSGASAPGRLEAKSKRNPNTTVASHGADTASMAEVIKEYERLGNVYAKKPGFEAVHKFDMSVIASRVKEAFSVNPIPGDATVNEMAARKSLLELRTIVQASAEDPNFPYDDKWISAEALHRFLKTHAAAHPRQVVVVASVVGEMLMRTESDPRPVIAGLATYVFDCLFYPGPVAQTIDEVEMRYVRAAAAMKFSTGVTHATVYATSAGVTHAHYVNDQPVQSGNPAQALHANPALAQPATQPASQPSPATDELMTAVKGLVKTVGATSKDMKEMAARQEAVSSELISIKKSQDTHGHKIAAIAKDLKKKD